ncbi:MAG: hypothetical protein AAF488_07735 [Planctomycetota bacterium]
MTARQQGAPEREIAAPSSLYLDHLRAWAPRVISLMDRERFSRTRGCMDRTFWAWKFTDFPGSRFQEGLCYLSFLYATDFEDNPYYQNAKLLEWIEGGFDYWCTIQRSTGDFDEAYPFERSLAATAFTGHYVSEAFGFVGDALSKKVADRFRRGITLAGDWLIRNDEKHGFLSNHLAAAAAALYHAFRITGESRFEVRSKYFVDKILSHQSSEGWYEEYGGADPGYQTHGSYYLARIQQLSNDPKLLESLERSLEFIAHFMHPDGSLGGEYTSRNTQTYYPAAFEMLSADSATASWIAQTMRPSVKSLAAAGLGTVDIYNLFPLLNNTVFAYLAAKKNEGKEREPKGPSEAEGITHFPAAGLLKVRRKRYDLYVGLHKGGVLKLFDRAAGRLVLSNSGYVGTLTSGKTFSSQWNDPERPVEVQESSIKIEGGFFQTARPVMDPWRFMAFRLFSLTFGRVKAAAYWLKSLLVKVLIYKKREIDVRIERTIDLHDDGVTVRDQLRGSRDNVVDLSPGDNFTTIHMGSSRYFVPNELVASPEDDYHQPIDVAELPQGVERTLEIRLPAESE